MHRYRYNDNGAISFGVMWLRLQIKSRVWFSRWNGELASYILVQNGISNYFK